MLLDTAALVKDHDQQKYSENLTKEVFVLLWHGSLISVEELILLQAKQPTAKNVKDELNNRRQRLAYSDPDDMIDLYIKIMNNPVGRSTFFRLQLGFMKRRDNLRWNRSKKEKEKRRRILLNRFEEYKCGNPKYPYGKEHLKPDVVASGIAMAQAKNKLTLRERFKAWIKGLTPMEISVESVKEERNAKKKEQEDEDSPAEDFSDDESEAESEADTGAEAFDDEYD